MSLWAATATMRKSRLLWSLKIGVQKKGSRYNLVTLASVKTWGIGRELAV